MKIDGYPGRGVLLRRRTEGGFEWAYFVTGRSESSRRRRARRVGEVVYIEPTGRSQADPLRHYACARPFSEGLIVGNGDHVDVLVERLDVGVGLGAALATIAPEPDPPIYTPRIGAVIREHTAAIFSVAEIQGTIVRRTIELPPGTHTLAVQMTYEGSVAKPIGSAPLRILSSDEPIERLVADLWSSLPSDLRVLLLVGTGTSVSGCWLVNQES